MDNVRSPEPSSGEYREAKKALSELAHSIKAIGGLATAYSIVPLVDETKLKLGYTRSISITMSFVSLDFFFFFSFMLLLNIGSEKTTAW